MDSTITDNTIPDEAWRTARALVGDVVRKGAPRKEDTLRDQVIARSYTLTGALNLFQVRKFALETALVQGIVASFTDPEGETRLSAYEVENIAKNSAMLEDIHQYERIYLDDLATFFKLDVSEIRRQLQSKNVRDPKPMWMSVRDALKIPGTLAQFREDVRYSKINQRDREREDRRKRRDKEREAERAEQEQRRALRQRLLDAFPAWKHSGREDQVITLHVGPPNSGKTHNALAALEDAGSGWYLAPLRLLAYEIFDRLNQRGTPCNLLTGEERIDIPGATITAATIEMFSPHHSGDCVVIDEAQMLADPDRGWAWTRALMETMSPDIHVIAPTYAQTLITSLADSAGLELDIMEHHRLAPIKVAEAHTALDALQPRTILIAFSRQNVLDLKMALEEMGRNVSIIYGALPPEVRRRQSDRFAAGETEICVATDAVGMGLNLPADHVVFYEIEKFDGRDVRILHPSEVQQIGGRAGRFGLAQAGIVNTLSKRDLKMLSKLFSETPTELTHARVAPTVDDLALLPGTLAEQLMQWSALQSIPETLRDKVKTADLTERIELAKMLNVKEVEYLGLERALKLINAPTNKISRPYWRDCVTAIITQFRMALPPFPPMEIADSNDLEATEESITKSDIYLWLANREEFAEYAPEHATVRALRNQWSIRIDDALVNKLKMKRQCKQCGRNLPLNYRYKICERCYSRQMRE